MTDRFILADQASALLVSLHSRDEPRVYRALIDERGLPSDDPRCLWARARRRYLRRIAALPEPAPRPAWWTATDEAQREPSIEAGGWSCRTCRLWRSQDGQVGYCGMEQTQATVNCGQTEHWMLCEQWAPWPRAKKARST